MRWLALALSTLPFSAAAEITGASYVEPTTVYGHNAIEGGEYTFLRVELGGDAALIRYDDAVFEDSAPRLVDFDMDGTPEVLTVVSDFEQGARVQIFDLVDGAVVPVASNAPIGTRFRWLAVAGTADFDGDGTLEIAYVDRPHLAKILRILNVRVEDGVWSLTEVGTLDGVTNHKYRDPNIEGGIRICDTPEVILADAKWDRIVGVTMDNGALVARDIGAYRGADSLTRALACE